MSDSNDEEKEKKDKPRTFVKIPDVFMSGKESKKQSLVASTTAQEQESDAAATDEVVRETDRLLAETESIQKKAAKLEKKQRDIEVEAEEEEQETFKPVPNTFLPQSISALPSTAPPLASGRATTSKPAPKVFPSNTRRRVAPTESTTRSSDDGSPKQDTAAKAPKASFPTPPPKGLPTSAPRSSIENRKSYLSAAIPGPKMPGQHKRSSSGSDFSMHIDLEEGGSPQDSLQKIGEYYGNLSVELLQDLETVCLERHDENFASFYESDGKATQQMTWGQIWDQSGVVSYHLRVTWRLKKGQTVALVLDYGLTYIATWLGCLRAGIVPIVVASPIPPNFEASLKKLNAIMHSIAPVAMILTDSVVKFWKKEDENDRKSATRKMWPEQAPWKAVDKLPKPKPGDAKESSFLGGSFSSLANLSLSSITGNKGKADSPPGLKKELASPKDTKKKRVSGGPRGSIFENPFGRRRDDDEEEDEPEQRASFFGRLSKSGRSTTGSATPLPRQSLRASIFGQGENEPLLAGTAFDEKSLTSSDVCCLQATSGSTADPKIVVVTFRALHESLKMTQRALPEVFGTHKTLSGFSWLPPDHHLGLFLAMLCPLTSGCPMHYMSSVNYEEFPLQWLTLLSTYKIGWTVSPDNGYRWVIREFMKTLNASTTIMTNLNLSSLSLLLNIGESPRFGTPGKIRKCFLPYNLPRNCSIKTGYGLAEHLLPISWIEQSVFAVPSCNNFALTKRVAVANREELEKDNIAVLVVDPRNNQPVSKGQVGEIWIWSPFLEYLPGYFHNKKLTKKNFQAKLKGKGSRTLYLRTGDVGLFKDDHLYICCRKEDVLANSQGIKFCPPDIEWFAEDCRAEIRRGRVAAFASVAGSVEIAIEVYDNTKSPYTRQVCRILSERIPKFTHMEVSSVVAVPQGTLPVTPISTVQRRHAKGCLLKEEMPILFDFPERKDRVSLDHNSEVEPVMDSFSHHDDNDDISDSSYADSPSKEESGAALSKNTPTKKQSTEKEMKRATSKTKSEPTPKEASSVKMTAEEIHSVAKEMPPRSISPPGHSKPEASSKQSMQGKSKASDSQRKDPQGQSTARDTQTSDTKEPDSHETTKQTEEYPSVGKSSFQSLAAKFGGAAATKRPGIGLSKQVVGESGASKHVGSSVPPWSKLQGSKSSAPTAADKAAVKPSASNTSQLQEKPPPSPPRTNVAGDELPETDKPTVTATASNTVLASESGTRSANHPMTAETQKEDETSGQAVETESGDSAKGTLKEDAHGASELEEGPSLARASPSGGAAEESTADGDSIVDPTMEHDNASDTTTVLAVDEVVEASPEVDQPRAGLPTQQDGAGAKTQSSDQPTISDAKTVPGLNERLAAGIEASPSAQEDIMPELKGVASSVIAMGKQSSLPRTEAESQEELDMGIVSTPQATTATATAQEDTGETETKHKRQVAGDSVEVSDPVVAVNAETSASGTDVHIAGAEEEPLVPNAAENAEQQEDATTEPSGTRQRPGLTQAVRPSYAPLGRAGTVSEPIVMKFGPTIKEAPASFDDEELDNILSRYLGPSFDNELSWEESGLSSAASVPMRRDLESRFLTTLPADYLDRHPTPADLKAHISDSSGTALRTEKRALEAMQSYKLSWCTTGLLQAFLIIVMFILFSAPLVPCWLVFEHLQAHNILYMLLVPIYLGSYSVIVIVCKWLIIGRYIECLIETPSTAYLRWWFIDRLLEVWECWVGRFILDTPLLWLFYVFMGAHLAPSCQVAGFIREFDLVSIGTNSSLKYPRTKCRKFVAWDESHSGPMIAFRAISIGKYCVVSGMLSPGVRMDEGSVVESLCVVPEGAIIEGDSLIAGNPAYVADETDSRKYPCWILVAVIKMVWLVIELAFLYGIWAGATYINPPEEALSKDGSFDYAYWGIFAATCILIALLSSIVVKILFIGSRRPGKQTSCCYYPLEWAADYHFNLVTLPFRAFARNSRFSNVILMLHGMSIDFASKVEMGSFPPSKMDLIRIRRSMLGTVSLDVKSSGVYYRTNIEDSSVGHNSHIDNDVLLVKAVIPPLTLVDESVVNHKLDPERVMGSSCFLVLHELLTFVMDAIMFVKASCTAFVAYLVWKSLMDFVSIETCIPICAASLAAQGLAWNLGFVIVERIRFCGVSRGNYSPLLGGFHWVYRCTTGTFQEWSFLKLTYGSPIFNMLAGLKGISFDGMGLYLGERIYDFPLVTIGERTVIDGATVAGHNITLNQVQFGLCNPVGLIHERSFIMANGMADGGVAFKEHTGPWEAVVDVPDAKSVTRRSSNLASILPRGAVLDDIEDIEASMRLSR